MDDPKNEIAQVVKLVTTAATPELQATAIERFFMSDAGFTHPLCTVPPNPGSRHVIKGIYEWYRHLSPALSLEVNSISYDEERLVLYLDVVQTFHIFLSPFQPAPASLLVRISLFHSPEDGKYYIKQQEDFYQPEDIMYLTMPFLGTPVVFAKKLTAHICSLNAYIAAKVGLGNLWRPDPMVNPTGEPGGEKRSKKKD